jgi:hypothetical protein
VVGERVFFLEEVQHWWLILVELEVGFVGQEVGRFVVEVDKIVVEEVGMFAGKLEFCYLLVVEVVDYLAYLEVVVDDVQ